MTNVICRRMRFHPHHGSNIELDEDRVVAARKMSFANALLFSERPLAPGEIFLIEIEENQMGWSGHIRLGLTTMNPDTGFHLPLYALPDLLHLGPSWASAIERREIQTRLDDQENPDEEEEEGGVGSPAMEGGGGHRMRDIIEQNTTNYRRHSRVVHREGSTLIRTPRGLTQANLFLPFGGKNPDEERTLLPTDVGSRVGVMYVPISDTTAVMHFIINGEDNGPSTELPHTTAPLYALVDVYGSTKRVRIIDYDGVESLKSLCRNTILSSIKKSGVSHLPLPPFLKSYLLG